MAHKFIQVHNARQHNLQGVDVAIPREQLTVITGLSGSGKSSLAFDTIYAEGQRRYVESLSVHARQLLAQMPKPDVERIDGLIPTIAIQQRVASGSPRSTVATTTEIYDFLRLIFARAGTPSCWVCGREITRQRTSQIVDAALALSTGTRFLVLAPMVINEPGAHEGILQQAAKQGFVRVRVDGELLHLEDIAALDGTRAHDIDVVVDRIAAKPDAATRIADSIELALTLGKGRVIVSVENDARQFEDRAFSTSFSCPDHPEVYLDDLKPRLFSFNSPHGACEKCHGVGTLVDSEDAQCDACDGQRVRQEARAVRIDGHNIAELCAKSIEDARGFFDALAFDETLKPIVDPILREVRSRLKFMCEVGVEYLTLDRRSNTLSGGEAQRLRLATQIGSGLSGVCYVLDEPTVGLHQRDSQRLVATLRTLTDLGNTVLVVEHDEEIIAAADHLIDMGPGAGESGGRIVAEGTLKDVLAANESLSAQYFTGERAIALPKRRRERDPRRVIQITGGRANNLKNVDATFPLGCLVCVTGVSGSGKSTLVGEILCKALLRAINQSEVKPGECDGVSNLSMVDRVIEIDQSPLGRSARSNPATYVGAFDQIRKQYALTREAKIRGYSQKRFSFNVTGGRCEDCQGQGTRRIEMHFLPDVFVECATCGGTRYNRETLEVRYRGKNIADVLAMPVEEAATFFQNIPKVNQLMQALLDVGLGYVELGQSANTLSGGEAQRTRLAAELGKSPIGHTMYILDEPTTGLHIADIDALTRVFTRLVDLGHTLVVVEHNLEVIKMADWVIDLGPEGGDGGGSVVVQGTPETVGACHESHTGAFLSQRLEGGPVIALGTY